MKKDKTILDIIEKLKVKTNFDLATVIDYWEADLCAIGVKRDDRMVYISTFDLLQGREDGYDYDLELLDKHQMDRLHVVKKGRNVTEEVLVEEIRGYLRI